MWFLGLGSYSHKFGGSNLKDRSGMSLQVGFSEDQRELRVSWCVLMVGTAISAHLQLNDLLEPAVRTSGRHGSFCCEALDSVG